MIKSPKSHGAMSKVKEAVYGLFYKYFKNLLCLHNTFIQHILYNSCALYCKM